LSASNTYHGDKPDRYLKIRVAFLERGTSLHAWCKKEGVAMQNARAALLGIWSGPKARALVARIVEASGVRPE
jgi:lambda repressor-like predicted transcriptional regulator